MCRLLCTQLTVSWKVFMLLFLLLLLCACLQTRADIAASFQRVAIAHLTARCRRAVAWAKESHPEVQTMVVAIGVACNQLLRDSLEEVTQEAGLRLVCPQPRLCTDNGVMVAWPGVER